MLGAALLEEGEPTLLRLANIWLIINRGGGPTDDNPRSSPRRPPISRLSIFLNLRVADIRSAHALWSSRGAKFITEPKVHETELRCYMRDPDGYLIEVGQTTTTRGLWTRTCERASGGASRSDAARSPSLGPAETEEGEADREGRGGP